MLINLFLTLNTYLIFHTKVLVMFMVFLPTKFFLSTPITQDVSTTNCRDAVLQSTPKELLFFMYVLAPKISEMHVHVLRSDTVATTSYVCTAQGPLLASLRIKFQLRPVTLVQRYFSRGKRQILELVHWGFSYKIWTTGQKNNLGECENLFYSALKVN
jgi:hypothetical protein